MSVAPNQMTSQLANASLALQVGGAFSSAIGGFYSARAQRSSLKFQADMAALNAQLAESSAQQALAQGNQQIADLTLKAGQLKSKQRVALAANGVDLSQGNAAEIQASTDLMKEIDANTLKQNAIRNAWGYRLQGTNYRNQALMDTATANSINPAGEAFTSLMGSAGNVAQSWYMLNKVK